VTWSARGGAGEDEGQAMRLTKAQEIQHVLADEIIHGRLAPGTALDETIFATRLGVSRTPVREAIRQLEAIGLVETRPHRGAVVRDIPAARLDDMFSVMAELEALCAKWAAVAMTIEERTRLREIWTESAVHVREGGRTTYIKYNDLFHEAVYDGSHNTFLAEQTRVVRLRIAPFRRVQFESVGRLALSHQEHGRVLEAIERGDSEEAHRQMLVHLATVRDTVYAIKRAEGKAEP
jgi:DNA-binding GntR family transcriptional regulator